MKIFVVLPTYNEADNIAAISAELWTLPFDDLSILIVDDNSPDGTGQIAERLAEQRPGKTHVIHRPGKMGLGTAYIQGFQRALALGADVIVQMDSDFSHSPDYLPKMYRKLVEGGYDLIVGSRYVEGGATDERWGFGRWLLSWFANSVWVRFILGMEVKDATAGFKMWRAGTLRGLGFAERVRSNGYIFQVEMAYITERLGYDAYEYPIYFEDRRIGQSKMDMKIKIEAATGTLRVWREHHHLTPADRTK